MKLKPFIVFKEAGAKRDVENMNKEAEFRSKCVLACSKNAWINNDWTPKYIDSVVGSVAFRRRLLAWDTYECHVA